MDAIDAAGPRDRVVGTVRLRMLVAIALAVPLALLAIAGTASAAFDRFPVDGRTYVLKPMSPQTSPIGVGAGTTVVLQENFGLGPGQYPARMRWQAFQTGTTWWGQPSWRLVNLASFKCLDSTGSGPSAGALLIESPCIFPPTPGGARQEFLIPGNLFGGTLIRPVLNRSLGVTARVNSILVTLEPLSAAHNDEFQLQIP